MSIRESIPRAIAAELAKPQPLTTPRPAPPQTPATLPPHALGVLAGLADAASTYTFLKRGAEVGEDNALLAGRGPATTAGLMLAVTAAKYPLAKLLGKRFPGLSRALDANMGATQLGYAGVNFSDEPSSATNAYHAALTAELQRSIRAQQGR